MLSIDQPCPTPRIQAKNLRQIYTATCDVTETNPTEALLLSGPVFTLSLMR